MLAGIPRAVAALPVRRTAADQDSEAETDGERSPWREPAAEISVVADVLIRGVFC